MALQLKLGLQLQSDRDDLCAMEIGNAFGMQRVPPWECCWAPEKLPGQPDQAVGLMEIILVVCKSFANERCAQPVEGLHLWPSQICVIPMRGENSLAAAG